MLDAITLENFKAFKKLDNLPIKPITILCGTNSSGKSSILQSILMLKQTLESNNPNQTLLLNGRFTKLGSFEDVVYQKREENVVRLSFKFDVDFSKGMEDSLEVSNIGWKLISNFQYIFRSVFLFKSYKVSFQIDLKQKKESNFLTLIDIVNFKITIQEPDNKESNIIFCQKNVNGTFLVNWKLSNLGHNFIQNKPEGKINLKLNFKGLLLELDNSNKNITRYEYMQFQNIISLINTYTELIEAILETFHYLGPLRGEPEREYIYRDEVLEIGNKGENAAYLFLTELNKEIENHYFYNKSKDDFKQIDKISLKKALAKWFEVIGVKDFTGEVINKIIYLSLNANKSDKTKVGIADVGFGISQIFPIFLEGLRMEMGSTLMLEQPEIHLHPNLQMQLSDYFIALAKSGKRFLVETHSDHVVNRLVRRIVEDETGSLKDLIGIYFIKPTDEGSVYEEIVIDDKKGIVNWPKEFFDQAANEQLKIMQAGLKKRRMNGKTV